MPRNLSQLLRRAAFRSFLRGALTLTPTLPLLSAAIFGGAFATPARAQNFRFILRAEPDVIAANGISTTSIFVQLPVGRGAIAATQTVRFATTAGTIESQAQLTGGVARVLLRSSNTPGTAIVTAFIGSSREAITVEFSEENGLAQRTLEIAAPYVAYGSDTSQITASGQAGLDFGDTHIESDVRLDVDLASERIWAQGSKGRVIIRQGRGAKAKELRGDRLFYDLRRKSGVIRRSEAGENAPARQEFIGADFALPPEPTPNAAALTLQNAPDTPGEVVVGGANPTNSAVASPSKALENPGNRGSIFVEPNVPPITGAPAEKSERPDAITPPILLPNQPEPSLPATDPISKSTDPSVPKTDPSSPATEPISKPTEPSVPKTEPLSGPTDPISKPTDPSAPAPTGVDITEPKGEENPPVSTVVPGSAAAPGALLRDDSRVQSLANMPRATGEGAEIPGSTAGLPDAPAYAPLPTVEGPTPRIVELPPPLIDAARGYWVAARRVRVFPRDKVQFERAAIYFNGAKAFAAPLYVLPLDGSFNPTTDTISFNSAGGVGLKFPFYYQATKSGTGAVYLKREQTAGFSESGGGFSLALDQQYWLSPQSHGKFSIDNVGLGAFNLNYQHQLQISPNTSGQFFLSAPRHRDLFARASLAKDLQGMQLGFEGFFDKAQNTQSNLRGQFFARLRPKQLAKSGWTYALSANALAVQRYTRTLALNASSETPGGGLGGGIGGPIGGGGGATTRSVTRPLLGQTLGASLQSPRYSPWRGSGFTANLLATGFNYSSGGRGFAPGANLSFSQKLGILDARLDYTYDKSNIGLYGIASDSFTNYVSGTLGVQFSPKLGMSSFVSRSLNDGTTYGSADLNYFLSTKWRAGLFGDYSDFGATAAILNYGGSIGRSFGSREISINYDAQRGRFYFELGNGRY